MATIKQEVKSWSKDSRRSLEKYLENLIRENYTIVQVVPTNFVDGAFISQNPLDITGAIIIVSKTDNCYE